MDIPDDELIQLWKFLHQNEFTYIMIGGFATNLHGFNRITADIDLWLKYDRKQEKFRKTIKMMGLGDYENLESTDMVPDWSVITLDSGFELDIMTSIKGFPGDRFDECEKMAPTAVLGRVPVKFLHINQLIEAKKASGRAKDLLDIQELENIREAKK